ncbi:hypothetical protein ACYE2N_08690 [Flavobacterium sp. MAHUQ-51]|uniref:hypothetical protein n=1 Tax=Flavobacterium sp. GCM10022190 TaxID=3252639 RepID=UPI00361902BE
MKITLKEGVTMELTAPQTYEVNYLDGQSTYTEPFIIIHFTKAAADEELKDFRTIIDGLTAFFATAAAGGAAASLGISVALGSILGLLTKIAGPLIERKYFQLNADGTLTQYMAYHYWGNASNGIDPTAWPIPGVDPQEWFEKVNKSIIAFKKPKIIKKEVASIAAGIENSKLKPEYDFDFTEIEIVSINEKTTLNLPIIQHTDSYRPNNSNVTISSSFSESFTSCMSILGLPVPSTLFDSADKAVSTINAIYSVVLKYGKKVTISELIGAGILEDALAVVGGCTAAFYLGACIGCGINAGIGQLIPST